MRCRARVVALCVLLAGLATTCLAAPESAGAAGTTTTTSTVSKPLSPPRTSVAQDRAYFTDVAVADSSLATYEEKHGETALRALLTDGSAFCALLQRERNLDNALVAEADGARGTESQTSLPLTVTTFNTIEAVALVTLCPSEQKLLPKSVRTRIRRLGAELHKRTH
jgi:hypothetical protein